MYAEFIAIYVALGVVAVLLIAVLILLIVCLKKLGDVTSRPAAPVRPVRTQQAPAAHAGNGVFCRGCNKQYDGTMRFCPYCGTSR